MTTKQRVLDFIIAYKDSKSSWWEARSQVFIITFTICFLKSKSKVFLTNANDIYQILANNGESLLLEKILAAGTWQLFYQFVRHAYQQFARTYLLQETECRFTNQSRFRSLTSYPSYGSWASWNKESWYQFEGIDTGA